MTQNGMTPDERALIAEVRRLKLDAGLLLESMNNADRPSANLWIIRKILDADSQGDSAEFFWQCSNLVIAASSLKVLSELMGADWIREHNLRTHTAEAAYGPGWLDE